MSHPDTVHQNLQVLQTFDKLDFPLDRTNIITVGNKIDKVGADVIRGMKDSAVIPVSCTQNVGLEYLTRTLESVLVRVTGRRRLVVRVRTGGPEQEWLQRNSTVVSSDVTDDDMNYTNVNVLFNPEELGKFRAEFIKI